MNLLLDLPGLRLFLVFPEGVPRSPTGVLAEVEAGKLRRLAQQGTELENGTIDTEVSLSDRGWGRMNGGGGGGMRWVRKVRTKDRTWKAVFCCSDETDMMDGFNRRAEME